MSEKVWISETEAKALVRNSPWARLKEPSIVTSVSIFDGIAGALQRERVEYGMSNSAKALLKFDLFIERTLESFGETNPSACRTTEGGVKEVDEAALRLFLKRAMDDELLEEFGKAPRFKVT